MKIKKPSPRKGPKIPPAEMTDFDFRRQYVELTCGHLTDLDTDAMMRGQSSPRDKLWCDDCCKWKKPKPKPKREPLPDVPLF